MRKLLGTILIILFIYVGFCGIEIKTSNDSYKIPPFIVNLFKSDAAKQVGKELKTLKNSAETTIK